MNSFLYRGSKDFEQNVVTGVIQAPCRELARLFLKSRDIDVYQLEVRLSTRTHGLSEVPHAPEPPQSSGHRSYFSRSDVVWGGCWLFAFAFMLSFAHGKPSGTRVAAANSQIASVSAQ